jgi:hypothetical protein
LNEKLICVGGLSSGVGKTAVVCMLLKALPGWAAVKVVPSRTDDVCPRGHDCESCQPPEGPYDVAIDAEIAARAGKDTARFVEAGASHVAFVRALPERLPSALEAVLEQFFDAPGVVVESTTAMPLINGLRILVGREGWCEVKDSAAAVMGLVDLFVVNREGGDLPDRPAVDTPLAAELPVKPITVCASLPPEHPSNQALIAYCRRFLEQGSVL